MSKFPDILNLLLYEVRVAIKFPSVLQASGPGKDAGNGVSAGWPTLKAEMETLCALKTTKHINCSIKYLIDLRICRHLSLHSSPQDGNIALQMTLPMQAETWDY